MYTVDEVDQDMRLPILFKGEMKPSKEQTF